MRYRHKIRKGREINQRKTCMTVSVVFFLLFIIVAVISTDYGTGFALIKNMKEQPEQAESPGRIIIRENPPEEYNMPANEPGSGENGSIMAVEWDNSAELSDIWNYVEETNRNSDPDEEITEEDLLALVEKLENNYLENVNLEAGPPHQTYIPSKTEHIRIVDKKGKKSKTSNTKTLLTDTDTVLSEKNPTSTEKKPDAKTTSPPLVAKEKFYTLQVASFLENVNAVKLERKLKDEGYPAYVEHGFINKEKWFRVRVGKFKSKKAAIKTSRLIKNTTGLESFIAVVKKSNASSS